MRDALHLLPCLGLFDSTSWRRFCCLSTEEDDRVYFFVSSERVVVFIF